jgi:hypothetical protein
VALTKAMVCLCLLGLALTKLEAQIGIPPLILVPPLDTIVLKNNSFTLSVVASSLTTMSYKWYKDGTAIGGATASSYTVASANASSAGSYYVEVSNTAGTSRSLPALVVVLDLNDIPVVKDDSYSTTEDTSLTVAARGILSNDTDTFGSGLTAGLVNGPSHGSLTLNTNGGFTYLPQTNFFGTDSFTYVAFDGDTSVLEECDTGGKKQTVQKGQKGAQSFQHGSAGENDYWIKKIRLYLSRENTAPNGNFLVSIGTAPNSNTIAGSLVAINPTTITNISNGSSFQPYDIVFTSPVGPLAAGTTYYLNLENEAPNSKDISVEWPDANNYPNGSYFRKGSDQNKDIRFTLSEITKSAPGTVTIQVTPVNDAPIAVDDSFTTDEDTVLNASEGVLANDYDVEGDAFSAFVVTNVSHGTLIFDPNGTFSYMPAPNYFGRDMFSYRATDGASTGNIATVTINVVPVNDAPVAADHLFSTSQDTPLNVPAPGVLANNSDIDSENLTALLVSNPAHGSVALNADGSFTYTPATDYFGADFFTYSASDGVTQSISKIVFIKTRLTTPLKIRCVGMNSNGTTLQVIGGTPSIYTILVSTNNTDWFPLSTNVALTSPLTVTDSAATQSVMRLYQVRMASQALTAIEENSTGGSSIDLRAARQGAQSFKRGFSGEGNYMVTKIVLNLSRTATLPNTNFNISIGTGINTGPIPGSEISVNPTIITNATSGDSFQSCEFTYANPIVLAAGVTYYLNLECEADNGGRIYIEGSTTAAAYGNGTFYRNASNQGIDAVFQIWGQ